MLILISEATSNSNTVIRQEFRNLRFQMIDNSIVQSRAPRRIRCHSQKRCTLPGPPINADFMDKMEGELNRRLALLAVLYVQRRTNPYKPEVSLFEIENCMGFPRDYLEFTTWYLRNKGYITRADNSQFTLTVDGVDFVETQRMHIPVLDKLLTTGKGTPPQVERRQPM